MRRIAKPYLFLIVLGLLIAFIVPGCSQQAGVATEEDSPGAKTEAMESEGFIIATHMSDFLYNKESVNNYFDQSLIEMGTTDVGDRANQAFLNQEEMLIAALVSSGFNTGFNQAQTQGMKPGFSTPLSQGGAISAPGGACPAGASGSVQFVTNNEEIVSPELLESIDLKTIPAGTVMYLASNDSGLSLIGAEQISTAGIQDIMRSAIDMNNPEVLMDLVTPQGWNTHLWNKLKNLQEPAQSLLDYHLWNVMGDIEGVIIAQMRQELQSYGVPQMVLEAFDKSANRGWFANKNPTAQDAFARMEIEAVLTGSVSATVYERRDFSITGLNQAPQFGIQTGEGTVVFESPEFGKITFDVDIALDQFDDEGRAIGGEVRAVDINNEYEVIFIYLADGSKEGKLYKDGVLIGVMNMEVDHERFQNYIDVETEDSLDIQSQ